MKLSNLSRTHQLVLGSIMAAINVIFALISSYIFAFSLLVMLFLPLASIVVALNVDLKYYPVYLIGTLLLSLVLNFANFDNTLFFLLPVLMSGLTFGLLIKHKVSDVFIILIVSLVNLTTLFITIPIINLIYDINFLEVFASFIGFNDLAVGRLILPSVLTLLAFMQTLLTLVIISQDAKYFQIEINTTPWKYQSFACIILLIPIIILMFFAEGIAIALFLFVLFLAVSSLIKLIQAHTLFGIIMLATALIFALVGIAIFRQHFSVPYYFGVIFGIIPIVISDFLWLYISSKRTRSDKWRNYFGKSG